MSHRRRYGFDGPCGPDDGFFAGGRGGFRGRPPGPPPGPPPPPGIPPFWGGGPGPWGAMAAMFRRRHRARRGDVRMAILTLLAEQPRNGYQLMQELEQRSHGMWRPSPGSMYPALQQLEDEGLVRVDTAAGGRTYHLTDAGKQAVEAREDDAAPWDDLVGDRSDGRSELMSAIRQLMSAAAQIAQTGTPEQLAAAQRAVREARRAIYRILAEDPAATDADDAEADADDADE
jgi:DNA-binding PadR family transcriptional regulator